MKEINDLTMELIDELGKMEIHELQEIEKKWMQELSEMEVTLWIQAYCKKLVELVIAKRREKGLA